MALADTGFEKPGADGDGPGPGGPHGGTFWPPMSRTWRRARGTISEVMLDRLALSPRAHQPAWPRGCGR